MASASEFMKIIEDSLSSREFVKITLSKPINDSSELRNVFVRKILIKNEEHLSFTFHYKTNDQVKNYYPTKGITEINRLLGENFRNISLFTLREEITLRVSTKGKYNIFRNRGKFAVPETTHDHHKPKLADAGMRYLQLLGVADKRGKVIHKMADKYRQINKYLEILGGLITEDKFKGTIKIVDMGSGKGYLTFALYEYLKNHRNFDVTVLGIEKRGDLVDFCNITAKTCQYDDLTFKSRTIDSVKNLKIDVLIALHACDTATDDAIAAGIFANASLIVTAPCCHKQIRKQVKGEELDHPLLKYGIFKERQLEMVTDAIRAMILEKHQYKTKIFEFVSNEHTRKNVMLVGQKTGHIASVENIDKQIGRIKDEYHIDIHYLEKLVE